MLGAFGDFVTIPEEMELDFLCCALARPWPLKAWSFPASYDCRYAWAFARAARTLTAHETMIFDGTKSADVHIELLSAAQRTCLSSQMAYDQAALTPTEG